MPTVKIDDQIITTVQAWKYAQALNDGNLPAKIEAYLNATGHFSDEFTQEIDVDLSDTGTQFDKTWKLFEPVVADRYVRLCITPSTSLTPASYILIKFKEGTTVIFWLKIDMSTGVVYYSTDGGATYSSALCTLTLDSVNYLRVYADSSVAGNGGIQSSTSPTTGYTGSAGALLDNNLVTAIDGVQVLSTAAAHGFKGFES